MTDRPDDDQSQVFVANAEGPDHRFTFANAAYKRLVGHDDLIGRSRAEVLPEIRDQGFIGLLEHVFASGDSFAGTSMPVVFEAVGAVRYVTFVYQPVRKQNGEITGVLCEGFDVTAERLATDRLAALQTELAHLSRVNAMSLMATTIAHELNQPLAAIRNYAAGGLRLAGAAGENADILADAFRAVDEAAERAGEIIGRVRMLMRRGEITQAAFDLRDAVAECIRLVLASATPGALINNLVPAGLVAMADRVQIQQVIINLLRNAIEAVDESHVPAVAIGAVREGGRLTVSIRDNGPGLSPAAVEDMFEWSNSCKEGGMGLGLSIARTIMETHGGAIWLASTGTSGSEFCFSMSAGDVSAEPTSTG
jgi:two-component system sensor kinase FixL